MASTLTDALRLMSEDRLEFTCSFARVFFIRVDADSPTPFADALLDLQEGFESTGDLPANQIALQGDLVLNSVKLLFGWEWFGLIRVLKNELSALYNPADAQGVEETRRLRKINILANLIAHFELSNIWPTVIDAYEAVLRRDDSNETPLVSALAAAQEALRRVLDDKTAKLSGVRACGIAIMVSSFSISGLRNRLENELEEASKPAAGIDTDAALQALAWLNISGLASATSADRELIVL